MTQVVIVNFSSDLVIITDLFIFENRQPINVLTVPFLALRHHSKLDFPFLHSLVRAGQGRPARTSELAASEGMGLPFSGFCG